MTRRSYGSGSLFVRCDAAGQEAWYGKWYSGGRRVKRKIGPKRQRGSREGMTRAQAERECRQLGLSVSLLQSPERRVDVATVLDECLAPQVWR